MGCAESTEADQPPARYIAGEHCHSDFDDVVSPDEAPPKPTDDGSEQLRQAAPNPAMPSCHAFRTPDVPVRAKSSSASVSFAVESEPASLLSQTGLSPQRFGTEPFSTGASPQSDASPRGPRVRFDTEDTADDSTPPRPPVPRRALPPITLVTEPPARTGNSVGGVIGLRVSTIRTSRHRAATTSQLPAPVAPTAPLPMPRTSSAPGDLYAA